MAFSASPNSRGKPNSQENLFLRQQPSPAGALPVQGMGLAVSIWISDLLASISEEEKAESSFICTRAFHLLQLPWPERADFHLIFTLLYQYITGMALSGL